MSRSYKKNPISKDNSRGAKQQANGVVRRAQDVPNGKQYKKFYSQYDICDWWTYMSKDHWIRQWHEDEDGSWRKRRWNNDFDVYMKYWYTCFKRK